MGVVEIVILIVVVAGIVIALFGWDRYRDGQHSGSGSSASTPTDEVFIDPVTGGRMRVWHNASTGQREYRPEEVAAEGQSTAPEGKADGNP
jgi:hypothetical protein